MGSIFLISEDDLRFTLTLADTPPLLFQHNIPIASILILVSTAGRLDICWSSQSDQSFCVQSKLLSPCKASMIIVIIYLLSCYGHG